MPNALLPIAALLLLAPPPSGIPALGRLVRHPNADPPARSGAMAHNLSSGSDAPILSWLEPVPHAPESPDAETPTADHGHRLRLRLRFVRFVEGAWTEPRTVVESEAFFANWADVPSVVETGGGALLAHWPQKSGDATYAYDVMLARSDDGGRSWAHLGPAHDDGTQTEHGFVSIVPEGDDARAFWLDGREMLIDEESEGHGHDLGHPGSMTLRTAAVSTSVGDGAVLDARVCECCGTSAALTAQGPAIVYRDRGAGEVRDVSIVRRIDGAWTAPRTVHADGWVIAGCPVNGPAIDASGESVVVAWFTGAVEGGAVRAAFSRDAGATFDPPVTVDETHPRGRVDVVLLEDGDAIVSWHDSSAARDAIRVRRVHPDGRAGAPAMVARTDESRRSGFPRIALAGDDLLIAWTAVAQRTSIRATTIPLAEIP